MRGLLQQSAATHWLIPRQVYSLTGMDAPCARAGDCSCMCVYFKHALPTHKVCIVVQGFIPTTVRPKFKFNQWLITGTAMFWIPLKLISGAHTCTIQADICPGSDRNRSLVAVVERRETLARHRWQLLWLPSTGCMVWGVMKLEEGCEHWKRRRQISNLKPDKQMTLFHYRN